MAEFTQQMILMTMPSVEGRRIVFYHGIVSGEATLGANVFKDMFANIRNIIGGRAAGYEKELRPAQQMAMEEMAEKAQEIGADAVVALDLDYETITPGNSGSMLMVTASGTAVTIQ
jgi:uncharacterized protein YbjQ (UPF0145 family)